jgi:hypothetical protein
MLGGVRSMGGELAYCSEDRQIQCSRIEEQGPNYLLDPSLLCGRDWGREGGGGWG